MIRRVMVLSASAIVTALLAAEPGFAQDGDAFDRTPQDCVTLSRVRTTRVVDDRTILFFMRNRNVVYRNDLPRECPRLARENRFSYESRFGRLCDVDLIRVLETFGARIQTGAACRLGKFHPITPQEADDILAGPAGAKSEGDVEAEEVELPDGEQGDGSGSDEGDAAEN